MSPNPLPPDLAAIRAAAARLRGAVVETPLLSAPEIDALTGGRVLIKAECLQRIGAFKARGALNALLCLSAEDRARGVVAWSSGNHAQAVAWAAARLGCPAAIVMPADAPAAKLANTRALGAEVVLYDRATESREAIGHALATARRAAIIPPYDHPAVIAGQGTLGLEVVEQAAGLGLRPDMAVLPASGGGLAAGVATAMQDSLAPGPCPVWAVEPAGFDDLRRSLASGRRESNPAAAGGSLCDGLLSPAPGEITFPVLARRLAGVAVVDDAQVLAAMHTAFARLRLVVEPSGAAALAAVLSGQVTMRDRVAVVVVSGGNVDPAVYARALAAKPFT